MATTSPWTNVFLKNGANRDANVDGSSTPVEFLYQPDNDVTFKAYRLMVSIFDGGAFSGDNYGGVAGPLANGIDIEACAGIDLLDGLPITRHADWGIHCHDYSFSNFGAGVELFHIRWTFADAGAPIYIDGSLGDTFTARVNDDLTSLSHHYFVLQGIALPG